MPKFTILKRIARKFLTFFRPHRGGHQRLGQGDLPPFYALESALHTRVRTWKGLFIAVSIVLVAVVVGQQRIIFHKLFQKMNEQVIIVPGSPEFFRVRPGQIPDQSIFLFAEYVAANLGNFTHANVAYHFGKVAEHMHPIAKGRFETTFGERIKDWSDRKVDQTFAYEPVKLFELVTDERGPKYVTAVMGTRTQYVEGHQFSQTREVLFLEFRPHGNLTAEKPFIFEIESLSWITPEQYEVLRQAKGFAHVAKVGGGRHEAQ